MRKFQFHICGNYKESYSEGLSLFETDFGRLWVCIGLFLLFIFAPFSFGMGMLSLFSLIGIFAIAALGLNILTGFTGQLSLAHGALFGIGAYSAAILETRAGFPFIASVPIAAILTAAAGIVLSFPAARLRTLYLCIATIAAQFMLEYAFLHWDGLTGGAKGLRTSMAESGAFSPEHPTALYFVVFISLAVMLWVAANLMRTRFGRAFMAIRDNETTAEEMGIPIFRYKLLSFGISAFYTGFAGALFARHAGEISPDLFSMGMSVELIVMIVAGGLGSVPGAIFGAALIVFLNEGLHILAEYFLKTGAVAAMVPIREFFYGGALVVFITLKPKGIFSLWKRTKSVFQQWPF